MSKNSKKECYFHFNIHKRINNLWVLLHPSYFKWMMHSANFQHFWFSLVSSHLQFFFRLFTIYCLYHELQVEYRLNTYVKWSITETQRNNTKVISLWHFSRLLSMFFFCYFYALFVLQFNIEIWILISLNYDWAISTYFFFVAAASIWNSFM